MQENYNPKDFAIICREFGKGTSTIAVYEIQEEITNNLINCLSLRSCYNPELRYFLTKRENLNLVTMHLKMHTFHSIPVMIKNKVIEL